MLRDASKIINKMHFGNKKVIATKIIRDLKVLSVFEFGQISLIQFTTNLKNAIIAFKALKLIGYLYSPDIISVLRY
jgi:hypothetical protein